MKIRALLILIMTLCLSCSDTIEFNTPAIQGNMGGVTWKADSFAGDIDFGGFLFQGAKGGTQFLQLITPTDGRGEFILDSVSVARAIFKDADGTLYSTANLPDPSLTLYPPDGLISVEDIDNSDPKRVTGTFSFTAFSRDGLKAVNFIDGVFHRVSLEGGLLAIED